jgi:hypothetical protein
MTESYWLFMSLLNTSATCWKPESSQYKLTTKRLTFAFQQRSDKASPRQLRQLDFIGQFSTWIVHLPGDSNTVAEALSRVEEITAATIFDNEELAVA